MKREYIALEGLTDQEQHRRERRGRWYRRGADVVTYGRTIVGAAVSAGVLAGGVFLPNKLQYKTIGLAAGIAGLGMADKGDGWLARKAVLNGIPITDADKKKDPFQDKLFFHMLIGSIALREVLDGNKLYGSALLASQIGTAVRDHKMTQSRNNAVEGAEVQAIAINKWKTGVQNLAHSEAVSPLADYSWGQAVVASTYILSNVMGIVGYRQADRIHRTAPMQEAA
ncbi:hypothetical protein KC992_01930 [Candidatus Saccharibacteria bacterium]|nr:hypothetical protein [Candidatus Saccharibacteria bacterium]